MLMKKSKYLKILQIIKKKMVVKNALCVRCVCDVLRVERQCSIWEEIMKTYSKKSFRENCQ